MSTTPRCAYCERTVAKGATLVRWKRGNRVWWECADPKNCTPVISEKDDDATA
jgi:hypothetical protein